MNTLSELITICWDEFVIGMVFGLGLYVITLLVKMYSKEPMKQFTGVFLTLLAAASLVLMCIGMYERMLPLLAFGLAVFLATTLTAVAYIKENLSIFLLASGIVLITSIVIFIT